MINRLLNRTNNAKIVPTINTNDGDGKIVDSHGQMAEISKNDHSSEFSLSNAQNVFILSLDVPPGAISCLLLSYRLQ